MSEGRRVKSLLRFFLILKRAKINVRESIRCVCSDMHKAYLRAIGRKLPEALHILDRYHIAANLSQGLDQARADESGELKAQGWEKLKRSRWRLLRRRKNLKHKQPYKPGGILQWDLPAVRAYLLKESRHGLWDYKSPTNAGRCLDAWCRQAMTRRLEPTKKAVRSLRRHRPLILNWFIAKKQDNTAIVEGLNAMVQLRFTKAFGFRVFDAIEVALYHQLGQLPEPELAHRFC